MRALVFDEAVRLRDDYPRPERGPGEALVRVRSAGICRTDLEILRGYLGFSGVLGHEFVGEVVQADDSTWQGQRVVADINVGCGRCLSCSRDLGHHCASRTVLGIQQRDGALAEYVVLPERVLVAVPNSVSDDQAVFAEPLAAALHVLDELRPHHGREVCVLGDGRLGQLVARALLSAGLSVTVVGHHPRKLSLLAAAGAATIEARAAASAVKQPSFIVEATGTSSGLALALKLVAPKGTVVLKSTMAATADLDLTPVVVNEISLVGSRCGNLQHAVDALAAGLDPTELIDARYPLDRAPEALTHAAEQGVLKVLVDVAANP